MDMNTSKNDQYKRLFTNLEQVNVPEGFEGRICGFVMKGRVRLARIKLAWYSLITTVSCAGAVYAAFMFVRAFFDSGFYQYLSLLFSADYSVAQYWQEIGLSLMESIPVESLVLVLATTAIFIWSLSLISKNVNVISSGKLRAAQA